MTRVLSAGTFGFVLLFSGFAWAQGQPGGQVAVTVQQNGAPGSGSFEVHQRSDASSGGAGGVVATGRSGLPVRVAAGTYDVVVRLDGAIDRPEKWSRGVVVRPGQTVEVRQSFATAILEVRVLKNGRRAAATVKLRRAGESVDVATLGAGVRAVVSAGRWDVVVRYRSEERTFSAVELSGGQARTLTADFDRP